MRKFFLQIYVKIKRASFPYLRRNKTGLNILFYLLRTQIIANKINVQFFSDENDEETDIEIKILCEYLYHILLYT